MLINSSVSCVVTYFQKLARIVHLAQGESLRFSLSVLPALGMDVAFKVPLYIWVPLTALISQRKPLPDIFS